MQNGGLAAAGKEARGTQTLVHMIAACWRRPSLLLIEVSWRWIFGIPTLAILGYEGFRLLRTLPLRETGVFEASLAYPAQTAQQVAAALALLLPPVLQLAFWLAPALLVFWSIVSGYGRSLVLKRLDSETHRAHVTLIALQGMRVVALSAIWIAWWFAVRAVAESTLDKLEPNLVGYFAWIICLSLGAFCTWALIGWIFSIAPLIATLNGGGIWISLKRSLRLGALTGKLIEVNLSLGIVKLALISLAIILSSIPLPFEASVSGIALYLWWIAVSLLYAIFSDFFQVARLAVFLRLWRDYHSPSSTNSAA